MRLLQKPTEETPSLSLWLSRNVPHERELTGEFLDRLGREKSLDVLLHLHDLEETRRQKRLLPYTIASAVCFTILVGMMLVFATLFYWRLFTGHGGHLQIPFPLALLFISVNFGWRAIELWGSGGKWSKRPWFSTTVQQNLITSLFDYADNPLTAEAFVRALTYYRGDRDRLARVVAELLPRLPDAPDALTLTARRILSRYAYGLARGTSIFSGEAQRAAVLKPVIAAYLARTGRPAPRYLRVLLSPIVPPTKTKETD